jgi:ferredoxin-NADP reductase
MEYKVKVMSVDEDQAEFRRIIVVRPSSLNLIAGKQVMVSINKPGLEEMKKPVPFASPPNDYYMEFVFKELYKRDKFNENLCKLKAGEEIIVGEIVGGFEYKSKGVFVVSGIGIVPAMSLFRQLKQAGDLEGNYLIYYGKTNEEMLFERELRHLFGRNSVFLVSRNSGIGYETRKLDEDLIRDKIPDLRKQFYIFGPESFTRTTKELLDGLSVNSLAEIVE